MIDAFSVAVSMPWAITQDGLETVLAVLDRLGDPEALAAKLGRPLDNARTVTVRDGVAVLPVTGPIARYSNLFSDISGATSSQVLMTDFSAALEDPGVHAIVLNIDSPGGQVSGTDELSRAIADARGQKPIVAYIGGQGASAAYWIASAADSIVADNAAIVGSIGIVMGHVDTSARDEKAGIKRREIVSSVSPDKRASPNTESGLVKAQKVVDDLAAVFVSTVARNRDTTEQDVAENYGRGGVLVGQAAKDAGMVDDIGSLESVIASLAKPNFSFNRGKHMANQPASNKGSVTVANTDDYRTALAAGYLPENIQIASVDVERIKTEAQSAGKAEGLKASAETAVAEATKAERKRIADIHALDAKGFEKEISEAIDSGASAGDTALKIMSLAKERGVTLGAFKADATRTTNAPAPGQPKAGSAFAKTIAKFNKGAK